MKKFYKNKNFISILLSVVLSFAFVAVFVYGATTIGTNVNTEGTLSVTGLGTFLGGATTTTLTLLNGEIISNAIDGVIQLGGVASTTSLTLLNGETITNATDGTIDFGAANLTTTGAVNFATASSTGLASLDSVKISSLGDTISDIQFGTCTVTIGSVTASSTAVADCTATGVTTSHQVFVTPYITNPTIIFSSASSTADNTIQVAVYNTGTVGDVDPADNTWSWMAIK